MTNTNPFDFSDLSDLPEELQKVLNTETADNARVYADVVKAGAAAGVPELNINQIIAAAIRMGIQVPSQQTVRGYLNKAIELGLISKPTRQTYAAPAAAEPDQTADDAAQAPVEEPTPAPKKGKAAPAADPLADL